MPRVNCYVLHPGFVFSRYDGDRHWISSGQLMQLYRVPRKDCIIAMGTPGERFPEGCTHLYPRQNGDYTLPATEV